MLVRQLSPKNNTVKEELLSISGSILCMQEDLFVAIQVGILAQNIINILKLPYKAGTPILIGDSNIKHMQARHPFDYDIYCDEIPNIIAHPDYVAFNKDLSIEYVKEFKLDNDFVKLSVRVSSNGTFFARTLYALNPQRVYDYIQKGTLKKV